MVWPPLSDEVTQRHSTELVIWEATAYRRRHVLQRQAVTALHLKGHIPKAHRQCLRDIMVAAAVVVLPVLLAVLVIITNQDTESRPDRRALDRVLPVKRTHPSVSNRTILTMAAPK